MDHLERDVTADAALSWALVGGIVLSGLWHLATGRYTWAAFATAVVAIVLLPPLVASDWSVMVPGLPLSLAGLPVVVHSFGVLTQVATYVAVAALALVVAVEIDSFSRAEMTPSFAIVFVVLTTLTVAALWSITQFISDVYLGTSLLRDRADLMWDLVVAAGTGIGAGILFAVYFHAPGSEGSLEEDGLAAEEGR